MLFSRRFMAAAVIAVAPLGTGAQPAQPVLGSRSAPILTIGGLRFRDLNRNGALDPYEDWRLTPAARARDLVARMTLEEKAGTMMHGTARSGGPGGASGAGTGYDTAATRALIDGAKVTSMITRLGGAPATLAAQNDLLQEIAESTRLGVPLTISTDPRHHFQYVLGASVTAGQFSQWPEPLGLAAIGDSALVHRFGDIARQEYRAVGIHMALSPQADLSTEPRWSRINGTFGEDAALAERLVRAYVEGFQHGGAGVDSVGVATVVKHWVGYGAQKEGLDSHSYYGRYAEMSPSALEYHIRPFLGAFAAHVAGVMPTYSILEGAAWNGKPLEQVGAGFNAQLLTDALRGRYGFRGLVITDWGVTNDCSARCREGVPNGERPSFADVAMPWGVEALPMRERFVKAVRAGVDQFGGTERADALAAAVRAGELPEARLDTSAARVLEQKFALGLFENPYVDPDAATRRVGTDDFREAGLDAQRHALVLLENKRGILPLRPDPRRRMLRVYVRGLSPEVVAREGWEVVPDPAMADIAIVRLSAPFERLHPGYVFGAMQHEGSLEFRPGDADYEAFRRASAVVPTIVTVYLDRPAILEPVRVRARALLANFGVSDAALLDVLTGRARPEGKLPFELPSSMNAVRAQRSDLPHDSAKPLYPIGYGRRY
ncbi:glycoside hydrolase family 3 domain protein (plasmid) [Gemmatirosa kalamazoonensis]|uniref:beta-glucosidase n=1 Tax=Gemmatirosa kalamazoonensis TaxID=861299 RepID=W0RNX7_9BACT|nr:glycoside hydrolase family 3 N-terminal domain-containing protein [Gemmatirosa kalamazoonensis]AHG92446.1 glycoside hydrolase family 3 domain protein [Gemmatirosa kalamazoonensis]